MTWQLRWSRRATNNLSLLSRQVRDRVSIAIKRFSETGQSDVTRLQGRGPEYCLKVGDWRVVRELNHSERAMQIIRVLNRREAYR